MSDGQLMQNHSIISDDLHNLTLSPQHFHDLSINFYPGFAERNAYLGVFKSTRKRQKQKKYNDHTPLYANEHKSDERPRKDTFDNILLSLSRIPGICYP